MPALLLPLLVIACTGLFFVVSAAGSIQGDVVRYAVPIGLAAPLLLAPLGSWVGARSRAAAAGLVLVLLAVHASGCCLPWSPDRAAERRLAHAEDRLLGLLAARRVGWVFGPYWDVYGLNFLSGETVRAIPETPDTDYHGYERTLGRTPVPFALISREPGAVADVARRAGLQGERVDLDGAFEVFLAAPGTPVPPEEQVRRLRQAMIPDPLPAAAIRSRIEILEAGTRLRLRITHTGHGARWPSGLGRVPQRAVRLGIRWLRDGAVVAEQRAELPRSLPPGASTEVEIDLAARASPGAPLPPGRYEVRIGLVQELVLWFEGAGDGMVRLAVEVGPRGIREVTSAR